MTKLCRDQFRILRYFPNTNFHYKPQTGEREFNCTENFPFSLCSEELEGIFNLMFGGSSRNMCMNTFKKYIKCSADKIVIHFKLAAYKNCNVYKFIASISFLVFMRNDEQLSYTSKKDSCASSSQPFEGKVNNKQL